MANELRGRFVWHELLTTDRLSAALFYTTVVGWKTAPWPTDPAYSLFTAGGRPVAGLMVLPEDARQMGAPPHWLTYVGTSNVDEAAQHATQLGARLLRPATDVQGAGRFAILQDPQGAVFGLLTPAQPQAGGDQPGLGEFSWHELLTDDADAGWSFYEALFGWEKTDAMDMGPQWGTYQMFGRNGVSVGGMFKRPPNVPAHWMPYAMLADAKAAAEAVTRLGGRIVNGPMEVPGGDWIAQGIDLQGVAFAVHSPIPAATQPEAKPAKEATPARTKPARKAKAARTAKPVRPARKTKPVRKATPTRRAKPARSAAKARKAPKKKTAKPSQAARRTKTRRTARKAKKR